MSGIGILLVNTGSPDTPNVDDIKKYLVQFLMDPHIVGLPTWFWKPFLNFFLLPVRAPKSSRRYQTIWCKNGSPLTSTTQHLSLLVEVELNRIGDDQFSVLPAMRYGNPSLSNQLEKLEKSDMEKIIVLPLFPQTSYTTTESIREEISRFSSSKPILFIDGYWNHPAYLFAINSHLDFHRKNLPKADRILFSFHGIPEIKTRIKDTYEGQCRKTASNIAETLSLPKNSWDIGFQSKFGPGKWIEPSTRLVLKQYAKNGVESVQVFCPGFAVDCLETLHEIDIELKETFFRSGGKNFQYIPALNAGIDHRKALVQIISSKLMNYSSDNKV